MEEALEKAVNKKIKSILISQPKPDTGKSPYFDFAESHKLKLDFHKFIQVEAIPYKEFRRTKIDIAAHNAVIMTSRNAIDHYFTLCEQLKVQISPETKYFCISEAVALYLQKYTQYRKRKVFFGKGTTEGLTDILKKYKGDNKFLLPCSDVQTNELPDFFTENKFDFTRAVIYRTVSSDLSDLKELKYDLVVFFSPLGVKSLFENFPDFEQNDTRIGAFGPTTAKAIEEAGLRLDIKAPTIESPSMIKAIEKYIKTTK